MKRDRMATVLRVRELVERQRLAERAAAVRAVEQARREHEAARAARIEAEVAPGTSLVPRQLLGARLGGIALGELVERASNDEHRAHNVAATAERALVAAAVERRSAERLRDRRAAAAAREERKVEVRRGDEVGLQQWRSRS